MDVGTDSHSGSVLFRGRFQPFTRLHYDCVRSFFKDHILQPQLDYESAPELVFCVVRDYETLASAGHLLVKHRDHPRYLRHVHFFNPLSLYDCLQGIKNGLRHCVRDDSELQGSSSALSSGGLTFQRYLSEKVSIVSSLIRLPELTQLLRGDPDSLHSDLALILEGRTVPHQENDSKLASCEPNVLAEKLVGLLRLLAKESLGVEDTPAKGDVRWLLPILDREDLDDYHQLVDKDFAPGDEILSYRHEQDGAPFRPKLTKKLARLNLPIYGSLIFYSYLETIFRHNSSFKGNREVTKEKARLQAFLSPLVPDPILKSFFTRAEAIATKLDLGQLVDQERELVEDVDRFAELALLSLDQLEAAAVAQLQPSPRSLGRFFLTVSLSGTCASAEIQEAVQRASSESEVGGSEGENWHSLSDVYERFQEQYRVNPNREVTAEEAQAWRKILRLSDERQVAELLPQAKALITKLEAQG